MYENSTVYIELSWVHIGRTGKAGLDHDCVFFHNVDTLRQAQLC